MATASDLGGSTGALASASGMPAATPWDPIHAKQLYDQARNVIRTNVLISLGVGLVPLPGVDLAALFAQQLLMVRSLGKIYGQDFSEDLTKKAVLSLIGAALPVSMPLKFTAFSVLKVIPLIGSSIAWLAQPILAAATTYAVGEVFNRHFATGGTFLSFDPVRHKAYFEKLIGEGVRFAQAQSAGGGNVNVSQAAHGGQTQ